MCRTKCAGHSLGTKGSTSVRPPLPKGYLSEEQLLLGGWALARLCLPCGLHFVLIALNGLLLHLHSQSMPLLWPWEPVQVGLIQQGLVLTELLLRLLRVALGLPGRLTGFGDYL